MSDEKVITDISELKTAFEEKSGTLAVDEKASTADAYGRFYATGKRKNAIVRLWLIPNGSGKITVNGKPFKEYFARPVLRMIACRPFEVVGRVDQFDIKCTAKGGGLSGQAGAVRHAISKALCLYDNALRPPLKAALLIRRDARIVERKKYGLHKARRRPQFSKR